MSIFRSNCQEYQDLYFRSFLEQKVQFWAILDGRRHIGLLFKSKKRSNPNIKLLLIFIFKKYSQWNKGSKGSPSYPANFQNN